MKKNSVFSVLRIALCLSACLLLLPACSAKKEPVDVLLKKAVNAGQRADWKNALLYSQQAFEQNQQDTDVLIMSALALENNDRTDEAMERITRAAQNQDSFMAQYTYGRMLFQKGKFDQCIRPLNNALNLKRNDSNTLVLLAKASTRLNTRDAADYWLAVLSGTRFRDNPAVLNELAVIYLLRNEPAKAKEYMTKAARRDPKNPDLMLNQAILYDFHLKNPNNAVIYYNNYLFLSEKRPELEKERLMANQRLRALKD